MAWKIIYKVRDYGEVREDMASEAAVDAKISTAVNPQNYYIVVGNLNIRRDDIVMIKKVEITAGP